MTQNSSPSKKVVLGKFRVQKNRKSRYVCLPSSWAVINGVEPGDYIEFSVVNGVLCARKVEGERVPKQGGAA